MQKSLSQKKNTKAYSQLYEETACLGGAKIQSQLGQIYKNGDGVLKDYQKALYWFKRAAKQGLAEAQYEIGVMYLQGIGVSQNYRKAFYWFEKAANQGHAEAQFKFCESAASQGDIEAQRQLANMYKYGIGVLRDSRKALDWYQRAANQGDVEAQLQLGRIYKNDDGVYKDYQKALYWFEKAISQEHWFAQYSISKIDDNYIKKILDSSKEIEFISQTVEPEQKFCFNFLDDIEQFLLSLDRRDHLIFIRRLGFKTPTQTLQAIAASYGITRERVRQIESKVMKKWQFNPSCYTFTKKIMRLLNERDTPLSLTDTETIDPWFKGISNHRKFIRNLVETIDNNIHIIEVGNMLYFCTINQSAWINIVKEAEILLSSATNEGWSAAEARLLIQGLLPETARELANLLWEKASRLCFFSDGPNGIRTLVSYGRGAEAIVKAILTESDTPLHYGEIARQAAKKGNNLDIRRVHSAAANVGFLFARGTYGIVQHIPFSDEQMFYIRAEAEHVVSSKSPDRQWHTNEILSELLKQINGTLPGLDKYLLDIILSKSDMFIPFGRMIWGLKTNLETHRINITHAVVAIIKEAGHPLSNDEIRHRLTEIRGVNKFFCIQPNFPLVRIKPGVWGINSRDVPLVRDKFHLDKDALAIHESQTEAVQNTLHTIFGNEDSVEEGTIEDKNECDTQNVGIDSQHYSLYKNLISKDQWQREEVDKLCKQLGLMTSGAIETINDWSFARVDDPVFEEKTDAVHVNQEIVEELEV